MTETTEKKPAFDKEKMKDVGQQFLSLEPVLITKLAPKLKKHLQAVYLGLFIFLAVMTLGALVSLFTSGPGAFLMNLLLVAISATAVRLSCEYVNKD